MMTQESLKFPSKVLCLALCAGLLLSYGPSVCRAENISVQLLNAKLRNAPKQFASSIADLKFGDSVTVKSKDNAWYHVTLSDGRSGYLHESAITKKEIVLTSRQITLADVAVDESQVYLAGKGFNKSIEQSYASQEPKADYAAIDTMTKTSQIDDARSAAFISQGKLGAL